MYVCMYLNSTNCFFFPGFFNRCYLCMYVYVCICYLCILLRERDRNVLFNDALNTFYLRLYGIRLIVTDHSDSDKGNPLLPYRLLLSINSKVLLYAPSHKQDNTYHGLCYTSHGVYFIDACMYL